MIGIGITAMILATIGHRRSMRALRADYGALSLTRLPRSWLA